MVHTVLQNAAQVRSLLPMILHMTEGRFFCTAETRRLLVSGIFFIIFSTLSAHAMWVYSSIPPTITRFPMSLSCSSIVLSSLCFSAGVTTGAVLAGHQSKKAVYNASHDALSTGRRLVNQVVTREHDFSNTSRNLTFCRSVSVPFIRKCFLILLIKSWGSLSLSPLPLNSASVVILNKYSSSGCGVTLLGVGGGAFSDSEVDGGVQVVGKCGLNSLSKSSVVENTVTMDSSEMSEVIDSANRPLLSRLLGPFQTEVGCASLNHGSGFNVLSSLLRLRLAGLHVLVSSYYAHVQHCVSHVHLFVYLRISV